MIRQKELAANQNLARTEVDKLPHSMIKMIAAATLINPIENGGLDLYKKIGREISTAMPATPDAVFWDEYVASVEKQVTQQTAGPSQIAVGAPAPEISLPNPDGKTLMLSSLKGKVVLLDFWASWCGPCRRANPQVVALYNKYKSKGFEIFSVSLDGVGARNRNGQSPDQIQQAEQRGKTAWVKAIKDDKLNWPYHVSDLRHWDAAPAQVYGVKSIPQAFLLDKEGNIAAVLKHGQDIEAVLKTLL